MLKLKTILSTFLSLAVLSVVATARAQEVVVPDPNLNTAIHEALGKPPGPLTQVDMLSLTNFGAIFRNITNLQGLEHMMEGHPVADIVVLIGSIDPVMGEADK